MSHVLVNFISLRTACRHILCRYASAVLAICLATLATAGDNPEYNEIKRLIGDAACQKNSECSTVAIGRNACGGPAAFFAWSSMRTDEKKLDRALATLGAQRNRTSGPGLDHSTCRILTDPGAQCEKPAGAIIGTCRLNTQTDGLSNR